MSTKSTHKPTTFLQRFIYLFAAIALMVLTSCPLKSEIKSLAGLPVNTEQGSNKPKSAFLSPTENCISLDDVYQLSSSTAKVDNQTEQPSTAPELFFQAVISYLQTESSTVRHPQYGNLVYIGATPLFLQLRKLII